MALRALVRWSELTGDPQVLELAGKVRNFLMQPRFWVAEAEPRAAAGEDHAHFNGSIHSWLQAQLGLLAYAEAVNDTRIKLFARDCYEYMRNFGIPRIGLFGESCTTADMTMLAIKLSDLGVGDYWEDVDCYVRNQLTEMQIVEAGKLSRTVASMPGERVEDKAENAANQGKALDHDNDTTDSVVERCVGLNLSDAAHPSRIPDHSMIWVACCQCNPFVARYCAWESIVRCENGAAQINLLLNRASPWLDIDSHLPYEGRVEIRNKTARTVSVRIPAWVDKDGVRVFNNDREATAFWTNRYLVIDNLKSSDVLTITFPMVESTESYSLMWRQGEFWKECIDPGESWDPTAPAEKYALHFRGNTLVDISPRADGLGYPLYEREAMKAETAPMHRVERFVPATLPKW